MVPTLEVRMCVDKRLHKTVILNGRKYIVLGWDRTPAGVVLYIKSGNTEFKVMESKVQYTN